MLDQISGTGVTVKGGKGGKGDRKSKANSMAKKPTKRPEKVPSEWIDDVKEYNSLKEADLKTRKEMRLVRAGMRPFDYDKADIRASRTNDPLAHRMKDYRKAERTFKAAYGAYEKRRLEEMDDDTTLRVSQKIARIKEEFEMHPDNPFIQASESSEGKYS